MRISAEKGSYLMYVVGNFLLEIIESDWVNKTCFCSHWWSVLLSVWGCEGFKMIMSVFQSALAQLPLWHRVLSCVCSFPAGLFLAWTTITHRVGLRLQFCIMVLSSSPVRFSLSSPDVLLYSGVMTSVPKLIFGESDYVYNLRVTTTETLTRSTCSVSKNSFCLYLKHTYMEINSICWCQSWFILKGRPNFYFSSS